MFDSRETCPLCGERVELTVETVQFDPRIIPIAMARGMDPAQYALEIGGADWERALELHMERHTKGEILAQLTATRRVLLGVLRGGAVAD